MYRLKGVVQHYTWGGNEFIPKLLNLPNKEHRPFAEYWLGAHPNYPSSIEENISLNQHIQQNTKTLLGNKIAESFGMLPYLFKVLDVMNMLSIQVHPDIESAKKGYKEEEDKGIPVNAFNRNYKDQNHKPELMVALGDFYLLHGFKPRQELHQVLELIPEFHFLKDVFEKKDYKGLYEEVMQMDQQKVNGILSPLLKRLVPEYKENKLNKNQEGFWAARARLTFGKDENYDRGIFSIYFFNLLCLKKGQGIYQPAGMPHAYLEGQNVEIMANSDNVLRAGLTDKHIDVPELMKHVTFQETIPDIIRFKQDTRHKVFPSPAKEFELHQYSLEKGDKENLDSTTGEILFLMQGEVELKDENERLLLKKGDAIFVAAGNILAIDSIAHAELFRVAVPLGVNN